MKLEDIKDIESKLQVAIPENIRSIWENYPLKGAVGNTDHCIWDDADSIISENKRLREKHNWPNELLFIGDDGAGNQFAININDPDVPMGIEFEDVSRKFNPLEGLELKRETLSGWFTAKIKEMVDDGYDIETGKSGESVWSSVLIIVGGIIFIALIILFVIVGNKLFDKVFG